ncbi:SCO family protein [Virgibacillus sp. NKC19-16]|uniref:SCO family protein n=1 Tax=Virgibacillus salidurans TaxID=2831673 RepID=UPI001F36BB98|nr:SCO family protein [Virgibacillus sp. NKC19-16]UJL47599.1 SCO family protein [Virgibacillus sp. NKC19-16]
MINKRHNTLAIILTLIFGVVLFYIGTDGFSAYTAESARTNGLIEERPEFPEVTLEDSNERVYPFSAFEDKYVMLTFIYTACTDVCLELEMNLAEVYNQIPTEYIGEDIVFLSISFDPIRDDPETLTKYRNYFNSDGETWRMARINDQEELDDLLDAFGVIVIPDGNGHFTHNSAFYLVDPSGTLVDVMDYTKIDEAAAKVTSILDSKEGG